MATSPINYKWRKHFGSLYTHALLYSQAHTHIHTTLFLLATKLPHNSMLIHDVSYSKNTLTCTKSPTLSNTHTHNHVIIFALQKYIYRTLYKYRVCNRNCVFPKSTANSILPISLHKECTVTSFRWPFTERPKAS